METANIYTVLGLLFQREGEKWVDSFLWTKVCRLPHSYYTKALTTNMMILGDGAFGGKLGLNETVRVGLCGISAPRRSDQRACSLSLCHVRVDVMV